MSARPPTAPHSKPSCHLSPKQAQKHDNLSTIRHQKEANLEKTYVTNRLLSFFSFLSIEFAISILVEKFWNHEVSISNDSITIEIETDIGTEISSPVLLQVCKGAIGIGFSSHSLPLERNFDFFVRGLVGLELLLEGYVFVQSLGVQSKWLVWGPIKGLSHSLVARFLKHILSLGNVLARFWSDLGSSRTNGFRHFDMVNDFLFCSIFYFIKLCSIL